MEYFTTKETFYADLLGCERSVRSQKQNKAMTGRKLANKVLARGAEAAIFFFSFLGRTAKVTSSQQY